MGTYGHFKPVSKQAAPTEGLDISKKRFETYKAKKLKTLAGLKTFRGLYSFLLRMLQDYTAGEEHPSHFEKILASNWERAGLTRGGAVRVLDRLYSLGPEFLRLIDPEYLKGAPDGLDRKLYKDLKKIDRTDFYKSDRVLNPARLQKAFDTGDVVGLNPRERTFLTNMAKTYKTTWPEFQKNKILKSIGMRLVSPMSAKYKYQYPGGSVLANDLNAIKDALKRHFDGLEQPGGSEPEPEPELTLWTYTWTLDRLGHAILSYDEATGDDPVFICNVATYIPGDFPRFLGDPHVYMPPDNEKHSNFRPSFQRIYPAAGDYSCIGGENVLVAVTALENDQWFSDDTERYVNFGLNVASDLARLDPTGVSSIVVAISEVVWAVLCFLDWLDDDDYVGCATYEFNSWLVPSGTGPETPYVVEPELYFSGSGSEWSMKFRLTVNLSVFGGGSG